MTQQNEEIDLIENTLHPEGRCLDCGGGMSYWKHGVGKAQHPFRAPQQKPSLRKSPSNPEEAVEAALLYVLQLPDKDYRKLMTAMTPTAFIRALEQDGYIVIHESQADGG